MKAHQLSIAAILTSAIAAVELPAAQLPIEGELPSLGSATEWLNSHSRSADPRSSMPPATISDLLA
jgi:hypothetical protein